ncbi:MAG: hypothetical protein ACOY4P_04635 [Pseudomonadota bacterium]
MKPEEIRKHLLAQAPVEETLSFLTSEFMPAVVARLNEIGTRRRMALYGGDRVPENERNLTDVRNRMSLLIEYKLAWIGNDILSEAKIDDFFWTNVVANRFPDLEVRSTNGGRGIRVEVKCLEAVAEEKSANFDTLKKDLNPETDFVAVFLWEWFRDQAAVAWDRAPKILKCYVFHASSLAELRDYNWLNNPPNGLGNGFQGYDFRFAVNCNDGTYNEEEGNYGKLLRIWPSGAIYAPGLSPLLRETSTLCRAFEEDVIWSGFEVLAADILNKFGGGGVVPLLNAAGQTAGFRNTKIGMILKRRAPKAKEQVDACKLAGVKRAVVLTDKYQWSDNELIGNRLVRRDQGRKPKHLINRLSENSVL